MNELIQLSAWIIDGNYIDTLEKRITAAEFVIYLEFNKCVCLWNVVKRAIFWKSHCRASYQKEVELSRPTWRKQLYLIKLICRFDKKQQLRIINSISGASKKILYIKKYKDMRLMLTKLKSQIN